MFWIMTGTMEVIDVFSSKIEEVDTIVEADSMDRAFEIARYLYGPGITGAQKVEEKTNETMA